MKPLRRFSLSEVLIVATLAAVATVVGTIRPEVRQQIFDFFARNGFVVVGKSLRIDSTNVYFQPLR